MSEDLIDDIRVPVGEARVLTGDALHGRSAGIWSSEPLQACALVRPGSTEEVAGVLRLCHAAGQSVIPFGGMTGLAGAHESGPRDIVLSTERMRPLEAISGSISAEHGIGREKKPFLHYTRNADEIDLMRRVKQALDPGNLMNPGKLFDP